MTHSWLELAPHPRTHQIQPQREHQLFFWPSVLLPARPGLEIEYLLYPPQARDIRGTFCRSCMMVDELLLLGSFGVELMLDFEPVKLANGSSQSSYSRHILP